MDLQIHNKPDGEFVECHRTMTEMSITTCSKCQFLRIMSDSVIKCGWSEKKEQYLRGEIVLDSCGGNSIKYRSSTVPPKV